MCTKLRRIDMEQVIKEIMEEISARKGGSLLKNIEKLKLSDRSSVLFIGLGGLGSSTVNEIKKVYKKQFEQTHNIDFLAVDERFPILSAGNQNLVFEPDEIFEIFDGTTVQELMINPPKEIKTWLGDLNINPIQNYSPSMNRQIGRLMLCGTKKYCGLRSVISEKIMRLGEYEQQINVVLVSGLSGTTGGGIFLDVAYMIRDIFAYHNIPTALWGCFYTPDVQKSMPSISSDSTQWTCMQSNGYAALKELDYFMSNGSRNSDAPVIYKLVAPGGVNVSSSEPIFDEGHAFIISPNEIDTNVEDIVFKTAYSLLSMYQSDDGCATMLSFLASMPAVLPMWSFQCVGASNDFQIASAPTGIDHTDFPVFMNYKYSTLGCKSVYFPRDEMMAYCAHAALSKVIVRWIQPDLINQKIGAEFARKHNIATIEQIVYSIKSVMERLGYNENDLRIDKVKHQQYWPDILGNSLFGRVRGTDVTMLAADILATKTFDGFANHTTYNTIVNTIADNVINTLNSQQFMSQYGPLCCTAILSGYNGIGGCCDILNALLQEIYHVVGESNRRLNEVSHKMHDEAYRLEADFRVKPEKVEAFIDACYEYSIARFECSICNNFLEPVIVEVKERLKEFNNTAFGVFVPVIEALMKMLREDAGIFTTADRNHFAGGRDFDVDAYGLLESEEKREQLKRVLDGYVDDESVSLIANQFAQSMVNPDSREKWLQVKDNPDELVDEIRNIFSSFFAPIVDDLLEKLLVLAYNPDPNLELDAQRLDEIWAAEANTPDAETRDCAIDCAAIKIANLLNNNNNSLLMSYEREHLIHTLNTNNIIMLSESIPRLNEAIKARLAPGTAVGRISSDCKPIITSVRCVNPIALPLVKNIKEYAQNYHSLSASPVASAGRHLDEGIQQWDKLLPEVYGIDAENYYVKNIGRQDMAINYLVGHDGKSVNNDRELYEQIRDAYEYGIKCGYIYRCEEIAGVTTSDYKILVIGNLEECRYLIKDLLKEHNTGSESLTFKEILKKDKSIIFEEVTITSHGNAPLANRIDECSEDGTKNVYRVIRSNMHLLKLVIDTKEKYENSGIFEALVNG